LAGFFSVVEHEQQGDGRAEYSVQLLEHLSEDLQQQLGSGFSISNLRNMRRFYLDNRIHQPAGELNWSQHVELLPATNNYVS
jgi:flagellar biosynthesis chaperone FliJ